jgi:hypothetical protein
VWLSKVAPNIVAMVSTRWAKVRSVQEGLSGEWLRDYHLDQSEAIVLEFFHLWHLLVNVHLVLR